MHDRRSTAPNGFDRQETNMLETIIIVLLVLWALGFLAFHVGGGLIHLLLVIALVVFIFRMLQGRRTVV